MLSSAPHQIELSVTTSAWLHNGGKRSLVPLVSFHGLLRAAEAKHLRWCDEQTLNVSVSTRYEQISGIVNISKMASLSCSYGACIDIGPNSLQQFGLLLKSTPTATMRQRKG